MNMKLTGIFGSFLITVNFAAFLTLFTLISMTLDFKDNEIVLGQGQETDIGKCITYDNVERVIKITCENPITLTDIYNRSLA